MSSPSSLALSTLVRGERNEMITPRYRLDHVGENDGVWGPLSDFSLRQGDPSTDVGLRSQERTRH